MKINEVKYNLGLSDGLGNVALDMILFHFQRGIISVKIINNKKDKRGLEQSK